MQRFTSAAELEKVFSVEIVEINLRFEINGFQCSGNCHCAARARKLFVRNLEQTQNNIQDLQKHGIMMSCAFMEMFARVLTTFERHEYAAKIYETCFVHLSTSALVNYAYLLLDSGNVEGAEHVRDEMTKRENGTKTFWILNLSCSIACAKCQLFEAVEAFESILRTFQGRMVTNEGRESESEDRLSWEIYKKARMKLMKLRRRFEPNFLFSSVAEFMEDRHTMTEGLRVVSTARVDLDAAIMFEEEGDMDTALQLANNAYRLFLNLLGSRSKSTVEAAHVYGRLLEKSGLDGSEFASQQLDACALDACTRGAASGTFLKLCSKCRLVKYCCRECQVADWKHHKKGCIPVHMQVEGVD